MKAPRPPFFSLSVLFSSLFECKTLNSLILLRLSLDVLLSLRCDEEDKEGFQELILGNGQSTEQFSQFLIIPEFVFAIYTHITLRPITVTDWLKIKNSDCECELIQKTIRICYSKLTYCKYKSLNFSHRAFLN